MPTAFHVLRSSSDVTSLPIACSLDRAALDERLAAWARLGDAHLRERIEISGGLALVYADAAGATVRELARLESECCAWASWRVMPEDGAVRLEVTAPGDGAIAVRSMFAAA
jgi:hypothetical protein